MWINSTQVPRYIRLGMPKVREGFIVLICDDSVLVPAREMGE